MTLAEMNPFARNDVFPSWWTNSIQRVLTGSVDNFQLAKLDATHIEVVAGPDSEAAIVSVDGKWRWIEATVSRAHPGGAAGTYDIYVVAVNNNIEAVPAAGTDKTNYAFELRITAAGVTPTIKAGEVDVYRKVGSLQWSGTAITRIDQTVPRSPSHAHRHATGQPDAIAPADIGAAPESGVKINFTVEGTFSTTKPIDLTNATGTASGAGVQLGDKIALNALGNGYGVGMQASRMVLYAPNGTGVGVRASVAEGQQSSGTDAIFLNTAGAVNVYGAVANPYAAFKAAADAQPYWNMVATTGALKWGAGGAAATDTTLERAGVGILKTPGTLEANILRVGANAAQTGALLSAVGVGNDIEFGHQNTAGYRSVLGAWLGNGLPFLAFSASQGTNELTFKTAGIKGSVFRGDAAGGFVWATVPNANADNQTPTTTMTLTTGGVLSLTGAGTALIVTNAAEVGGTLKVGGAATFTAEGTGLTVSHGALVGSLKSTGIIEGENSIYASAPNSTNQSAGAAGTCHTLHSPQNAVTLFVGYGGSTAAFTGTEYSGAIRFGGAGTFWGDVAYFPNDGGSGHFRFYRDGTTVGIGTATADVGVKSLYVQGALGHRGTTIGFFNTTAIVQSKGWGTTETPAEHKAQLTYASTQNEIVDYLMTLAGTLKSYGLLGT